jgi:glycosyltransferase involved in cell wall biosynthesis
LNFVFIHQNFPAQYVHAAAWLAAQGHNVVSVGQANCGSLADVRRIEYSPEMEGLGSSEFTREFELSTRNGLAVARECERLKTEGFTPDLVIGHVGWGETLFVKDVWPAAPLLGYFEFYYHPHGSDVDFDPEFPPDADAAKRVRLRNAVNLLSYQAVDRGQTPTRWQWELFPEDRRSKIAVVHEGVDTEMVRPDPTARLWLSGGVSLGAEDEVVTFCARNLEPYRGFHVFMRALPRILAARPQAHAVLLGGDGVSYGRWPQDAPSWRAKLMAEVGDRLDFSRVHLLGRAPFAQYLSVLQLSTAHVYLTYPFVLSWSLVEALSAGAMVVASRTAPVQEAIEEGVNGWLTDFLDADALAEKVIEALRERESLTPLREAARRWAIENYDLRRVCLPAQIGLWEQMTGKQIARHAQSTRRRAKADETAPAAGSRSTGR